MNFFYQTRLVLIIYLFSALSFMEQATVEGNKLKCYKKDECSCIVNSTKPQLQISLWPIESNDGVMSESGNWRYSVNLCRGVHMTSKTNSGCQNSTVCQYNYTEVNKVFEIGRYGSAEFGLYDTVTKSMYVHYCSVEQGNVNRSILIQLQCTNKGKASDAKYIAFGSNVLSLNKFVGTIKTKAACLSRVVTPTRKPTSTQTSTTSSTSSTIPTSRSTTSSIPTSANTSSSSPTHKLPETRKNHGGLSTVYIVLITIGSFAVLCVCCFVVYILIMKRRKKSILESEQETLHD